MREPPTCIHRDLLDTYLDSGLTVPETSFEVPQNILSANVFRDHVCS